jgi:hypothetical protein
MNSMLSASKTVLSSPSAREAPHMHDQKRRQFAASLVFLAPASLLAELQAAGLDKVCVFRPDAELLSIEAIGAGLALTPSARQLDKLPIGILILQGISSAERARLADLVPPIPSDDPPLFFAQGASIAQIAGWMTRRATAAAAAFSDHLARSSAEIARLQRLWREQEEALRRAETALMDAGGVTTRLAVFFPPSASNTPVRDYPLQHPLVQNTRRLFQALAGIELFFVEPGAAGKVRIEAKGAYSGRSLAVWTVEERELIPGWNRFNVEGTRDSPLAEAIAIEISSDSKAVARVALGETAAEPGLSARIATGSEGRPLALRLHEGVAGLAGPSDDFGFAPDGTQARARRGRARAQNALARAALLCPAKGIVRYEGEAGLLVHPPPGRRPTIAVIRDIAVERLRAVSAEIALRSDLAPPIDFGLLAAAAREACTEPRSGIFEMIGLARESAIEKQAAWLRLQGKETGRLTYEAPHQLTGRVDLFLMTRAATRVVDYAWAYFQGLLFDFSD